MGIVLLGIINAILLYFLYSSGIPNAKTLFLAFVIMICIVVPPLGVILVCVGIVYFFITSIQEANNEK